MPSTSKLKQHIIANFSGKLLQAVIIFFFVPVYARLLGSEAFGLVGFYTTLLSVFSILDGGLSMTATREAAHAYAQTDKESKAATWQNIYRIERLYWAIAIVICCVLLLLSGAIANNWLHREQLSAGDVHGAVIMMAFALSIRWPVDIYMGVLQGMQKQVSVNIINVSITLLKTVGAVAILVFISRSVIVFFVWQSIVSLSEILLYLFLYRALKRQQQMVTVNKGGNLWNVLQFSAGVSVLNVLVMIISQSDKIVISKFLSLQQIGYYSLTVTMSGALFIVSSAVTTATFPRITGLLSEGNVIGASKLFRDIIARVAIVLAGMAGIMVFFPFEVLIVWTRNAEIASQGATALSFLAVGCALNGIVQASNQMQLAAGKPRPLIGVYLCGSVIAIVCSLLLIPRFGIAGGGGASLAVNLLFFFAAPYFASKITRVPESYAFFSRTLLPIGAAVVIFTPVKVMSLYLPISYPVFYPAGAGILYGILVAMSNRVTILKKLSLSIN